MKDGIEKMKSERFQIAIDDFVASLEKMKRIVGEENFNFIASITIFYDFIGDLENEGDFKSDGYIFTVGDMDTNAIAAEGLLEAIDEKMQEGDEQLEQVENKVVKLTGFGNNPQGEA